MGAGGYRMAMPSLVGALVWRAGLATLHLEVPTGLHVAEDAPGSLEVGAARVEGVGDLAGTRLRVPAGRVDATLRTAVCRDDGSECRPVTLVGAGVLGGKKATIPLTEAVSVATAGGGVVVAKVYDFTAVWCPPCNLLAAEVLHVESGLPPIEPADVDEPASWALKDRYHVAGYPTLVAVDAAGGEVARLVGYPGHDETMAWFGALGTEPTIAALEAGLALDPAASAKASRRLAEGQRDEAARRYLATASEGEDAQVARLLLDDDKAAAAWLVAHAAPGEWLLSALQADPALLEAAAPKVAALPAASASDAFAIVAEARHDPALFAVALVTLRSALTGDLHRDRGHATSLASLEAALGDVDGAIAELDRFKAAFPGEFTWDHAAAGQLLEAGRHVEAETRARAALALARGDQRYRAAMLLARALAVLGRRADAVRVLEDALRQPAPDAALDVRSHRYRKQVDELRQELSK